jgi:AraC-like DNA-binding protein
VHTTSEGLLQVPFGNRDEVRHSPRYQWDNAQRGTDPFVIFQYTQEGEGIFEIDGIRNRVPKGHALIALVPEPSRYSCGAHARVPWVFSWVNFYGDLNLRLWRELRDQAGPVVALAPPVVRMFHRLCARASARDWVDPYEASLAAYQFYLEMLRHLPQRAKVAPLEAAISYFRAHFQAGVRMKEVATHLGMSREHFTRLFTAEMGQSPAAFLRGLRIEAAARLLQTTDLPVTEIAFRCGWTSPTKLDLFFKRIHGVSPKEYRQRKVAGAGKKRGLSS